MTLATDGQGPTVSFDVRQCRGHTSGALVEFDPAFTDRVAILADRKDGTPLGSNAAPFQLILADEKRPARWVRQVVSIEVQSPR